MWSNGTINLIPKCLMHVKLSGKAWVKVQNFQMKISLIPRVNGQLSLDIKTENKSK